MIEFLRRNRYKASVVILGTSVAALGALFGLVPLPNGYDGLPGPARWAYTVAILVPCYLAWCGFFLMAGGVKGFIVAAYYGFWVTVPLMVVTFFILVARIDVPIFASTACTVVPMLLLQSVKDKCIAKHAGQSENPAAANGKLPPVEPATEPGQADSPAGLPTYPAVLHSYVRENRQVFLNDSLHRGFAGLARAAFSRRLTVSFTMRSTDGAPDGQTLRLLDRIVRLCDRWGGSAAFAGAVLDFSKNCACMHVYYSPKAGYRLHKKLQALAKRYGIAAQFDSIVDAGWDYYDQELVPDEWTLFRLRNGLLSYNLQREGADIGTFHNIYFFLHFENGTQSGQARDTLAKNGYEWQNDEEIGDSSVDAVVLKRAKLGEDALNAMTDWLLSTLGPLSGRLDHFEIEPLEHEKGLLRRDRQR